VQKTKGIYIKLCVAALFALACGAVSATADDPAASMMASQIDASPERSMPLIIYIGTNEYQLENVDAATREGITLGVYNLDARRNLERRMMEGLPTSPEESNLDIDALQAIVEQRFNALSQDELTSIFQAIMLVQRWDIRKAPAFVFGNGQAVIYGLTDVEEMLEFWREWQSTEGLQ